VTDTQDPASKDAAVVVDLAARRDRASVSKDTPTPDPTAGLATPDEHAARAAKRDAERKRLNAGVKASYRLRGKGDPK
jgi:hypothetical protein